MSPCVCVSAGLCLCVWPSVGITVHASMLCVSVCVLVSVVCLYIYVSVCLGMCASVCVLVCLYKRSRLPQSSCKVSHVGVVLLELTLPSKDSENGKTHEAQLQTKLTPVRV